MDFHSRFRKETRKARGILKHSGIRWQKHWETPKDWQMDSPTETLTAKDFLKPTVTGTRKPKVKAIQMLKDFRFR